MNALTPIARPSLSALRASAVSVGARPETLDAIERGIAMSDAYDRMIDAMLARDGDAVERARADFWREKNTGHGRTLWLPRTTTQPERDKEDD